VRNLLEVERGLGIAPRRAGARGEGA